MASQEARNTQAYIYATQGDLRGKIMLVHMTLYYFFLVS